ncbi:MAG: hypothetical protein ACYCZJ_13190 [Sulfuriferula sp.]
MKAEFQWVDPKDIRNVWQTIKPGLEITAKKAPGGWIPEDVYLSLKTGDSVLHLVTAESYYRGFLISKSLDTNEGRKLLLWITYGDASGDIFSDNMETIRDWASNIGAVKIQFQSPRKGWERVGAKLGFKPTMVIYECDV